MESGKDVALASYLTRGRRPTAPSPFHFVIPTLAPMSSLEDSKSLNGTVMLEEKSFVVLQERHSSH